MTPPCTKRSYLSRKAAMRSVCGSRARGQSTHAYKCKECKKWHMSSGDHRVKNVDYHRQKALERGDVEWLGRRMDDALGG